MCGRRPEHHGPPFGVAGSAQRAGPTLRPPRRAHAATGPLIPRARRAANAAARVDLAIELIALILWEKMTPGDPHASTEGRRAITSRSLDQHAPLTVIGIGLVGNLLRTLGRRTKHRQFRYGEHDADQQIRDIL